MSGGDVRRRRRRPKTSTTACGICGDETHTIHFGGIACDSCRAFFRRAVHKDAGRTFRCAYSNNCTITVSDRNSCRKCRYTKCLQIGMNPKYVLSESDRVARTGKRTSGGDKCNGRQPMSVEVIERIYNPDIQQFKDNLSHEEYSSVVGLVCAFSQVASQLTHDCVVQEISESFPNITFKNELAVCVGTRSRASRFSMTLSEFKILLPCDRERLLSQNVFKLVVLRKSFGFDPKRMTWPNERVVETRNSKSSLTPIKLESWTMSDHLQHLRRNLVYNIQKLQIDEPSVILLMIIMLFSPETSGLIDVDEVSAIQERFLSILRKYVQWRYGVMSVSVVYPKLLSLVTDLQEIDDRKNEISFPCDDSPNLSYLYSRLIYGCPLSPVDSPPNDGHPNSDSGYGTDHLELEDSQGPDDLFSLLESLDDVSYDQPDRQDVVSYGQPTDLLDVINTDELLQPLFTQLPDFH